MTLFPDNIGETAAEDERLYLPYAAAIEDDELQPQLESVSTYTPQEAAQFIINGMVPPEGAVVEFREGLGAYDLVTARTTEKGLELIPASKEAVHPLTDEIVGAGLVTLTFPNGIIRPIAVCMKQDEAYWRGGRTIQNDIGKIAIFPIDFNLRKDYELDEIMETGVIKTVERARYF